MSKQKKITWTPAKQNELEEQIVYRTITLVLATLMDEYDYTREDLEEFSKRFCRYNSAVKEHIITISVVKDIILEQLGIRIRW